MVELTSPPEAFKLRMREFFRKRTECRQIKISKNEHIYSSGQREPMVYFIESGGVKLLLPSAEGKEYLLAIRCSGDIFGELCLSGQSARLETAVAMRETTLRQIPQCSFLMGLKQELLLEGLVQYLAVRLCEQQEITTAMATANSEQRLAKTLLYLSRCLGRKDSLGTHIDQKLSQCELSEMVGTTRTRIGIFLKKFRDLGLIRLSEQQCLIIEQKRLAEYLERGVFEENSGKSDFCKPCGANLDEGVYAGSAYHDPV